MFMVIQPISVCRSSRKWSLFIFIRERMSYSLTLLTQSLRFRLTISPPLLVNLISRRFEFQQGRYTWFLVGRSHVYFCVCSPAIGLENHAYLCTLLFSQLVRYPCKELHCPVHPQSQLLAQILHKCCLRQTDSHNSQPES